MEDIGQKIREILVSKKISIGAFADSIEMSRLKLNRRMNNNPAFDLPELRKISQVLNMSLDDIMGNNKVEPENAYIADSKLELELKILFNQDTILKNQQLIINKLNDIEYKLTRK
jgi:transcriptional regulator with XRE-family HTH domain